jgi:Icc-related predicted phosphoesterase
MLLIYTADLHGRKEHYDQLQSLINKVGADAVILGGDLFEYTRNPQEQLLFLNDFLFPYFKSITIPIYLIAGNTDISMVFDRIKNKYYAENLHFLDSKPAYIDSSISILGSPFITPSPFRLKNFERRDLSSDTVNIDAASFILSQEGLGLPTSLSMDYLNNLPSIEDELELFNFSNSIWVTHVPPYGGILDVLHNGMFVGSKALREEIINRNMARELGSHNITVNMVPGGLLEKMDASSATPDEVFQIIKENTPLQKVTTPEDVADSVLFSASPWSRAVTGQNLVVDGGLVMD